MKFIPVLYTILLSMLFFSGSMITLKEGMRGYQNYIVIALIAMMMMHLLVVQKKISVNIFNKVTFFMLLYFISGIISAIFNDNFRMFLHPAQLFVIYIIIGLIIYGIFEVEYLKMIIIATLISHVPLILISLVTQSIFERPYSGIFYNANSFGTVIATVFPILIVFIDEQIVKNNRDGSASVKNTKKMILYMILSLILFYLLLISGSRTSQATVILIIIVSLILLNRRVGLKSTIMKITPTILSLMVILLLLPPVRNAIIDVIEKSLLRLEHSSGLTSGRYYFWELTIQHAKLFGNGQNFFGEVVPNSAHNTFFEILGIYGWVPLIFFSIWISTVLFNSLRFTKDRNTRFSSLPLLMILTFIFLSMGEVMTLKLSMFTFFACTGPVLKKGKKIII